MALAGVSVKQPVTVMNQIPLAGHTQRSVVQDRSDSPSQQLNRPSASALQVTSLLASSNHLFHAARQPPPKVQSHPQVSLRNTPPLAAVQATAAQAPPVLSSVTYAALPMPPLEGLAVPTVPAAVAPFSAPSGGALGLSKDSAKDVKSSLAPPLSQTTDMAAKSNDDWYSYQWRKISKNSPEYMKASVAALDSTIFAHIQREKKGTTKAKSGDFDDLKIFQNVIGSYTITKHELLSQSADHDQMWRTLMRWYNTWLKEKTGVDSGSITAATPAKRGPGRPRKHFKPERESELCGRKRRNVQLQDEEGSDDVESVGMSTNTNHDDDDVPVKRRRFGAVETMSVVPSAAANQITLPSLQGITFNQITELSCAASKLLKEMNHARSQVSDDDQDVWKQFATTFTQWIAAGMATAMKTKEDF